MSRFFRIQADETVLTDALFSFVTDPRSSRNDAPVVRELNDVAPEMIEVCESMILDGVDERDYVADYVHAVVSGDMGADDNTGV